MNGNVGRFFPVLKNTEYCFAKNNSRNGIFGPNIFFLIWLVIMKEKRQREGGGGINLRQLLDWCQHMFLFAPKRRSHPFASFWCRQRCRSVIISLRFHVKIARNEIMCFATRNSYRLHFTDRRFSLIYGGVASSSFGWCFLCLSMGSSHLSDTICNCLWFAFTHNGWVKRGVFRPRPICGKWWLFRSQYFTGIVCLKQNVPAEIRHLIDSLDTKLKRDLLIFSRRICSDAFHPQTMSVCCRMVYVALR